MNNICFFTYTHTNCRDIWSPYFDSLDKFAGEIKSYVLSDISEDKFSNHKFITYDDNLNYCEEFVKALQTIDEEYFIYMQEDFILYDNINKDKILKYINVLEKTKFSFIRLIKCGDVTETNVVDDLYLINQLNKPHNSINSFSMQPTIWKKKDFINLYLNTKKYKFGEGWEYTRVMNDLKMNGLYVYNGENRRGGHHDSSVFPYIATAIVKGKWNYSEYQRELEKIFEEYNIDKNIRGCI